MASAPAVLNNFSPASFDALVIAAAMPQTSGVNFCDFTYVLGPSSATDHEPFRLLLTFLGRFSAIASTIRVLTLRAEVCDNHRLSYRTLFDVLLLTLQLAEFRLDGMAWHSGAPFPAPLGVARHLRHLQLKNMRNASTDSSFLDILTLVTEWHTVDLIDVVQQGSPQFARPASVRALSIAHTHLDASAVIPVPDLSPGVGALHALILVHVVHSEQTAIRALLHASRQTLRQLWISFSHDVAHTVVRWDFPQLQQCERLWSVAFEIPVSHSSLGQDQPHNDLSDSIVRLLRLVPAGCSMVGIRFVLPTVSVKDAQNCVDSVDWRRVSRALKHISSLEFLYCEVGAGNGVLFGWEQDVGPQLWWALEGLRRDSGPGRWRVCGFTNLHTMHTIVFRRKDTTDYSAEHLCHFNPLAFRGRWRQLANADGLVP